MKHIKLATMLLLSALVLSTTACDDFIEVKGTETQQLAKQADAFYNLLENEETYDTFFALEEKTATLNEWNQVKIVKDAPGMEYFDTSSTNDTLSSYREIKRYVYAFHELRERGENITLNIPEDAVSMVGDKNAVLDMSKTEVYVNGELMPTDISQEQEGLGFSKLQGKWIIRSESGTTVLVPEKYVVKSETR